MGNYLNEEMPLEEPLEKSLPQIPSIEERKHIAQKRLEYFSKKKVSQIKHNYEISEKEHKQYIADLLN